MSSSPADPWDDWESEDYSRGATPPVGNGGSENARLWQIANSSLSFGPQTTSTSSTNGYAYAPSSSSIPPPSAYMPSLKILKRPTSAASSSSTNSGAMSAAAQAKTMKDRERAYLEARKKIFGEESIVPAAASGNSSPAEGSDTPPPATTMKKGKKGKRSVLLSPNATDTDSPPTTPRPSTPSTPSLPASGIKVLREPLHPPSSKGNDPGPVKGFLNTRGRKKLSPAAMSFVPKGLVPSKVADKKVKKLQREKEQEQGQLQEGMQGLSV